MPVLRSLFVMTAVAVVLGTPAVQAGGPLGGRLLSAHPHIQGLGTGEVVVNSQVVSDEVVGVGLAGGTSFIGDMSSGSALGDQLAGGCVPRTYGYPDLFYNNYTRGNCNATNAQMYVAPVPTPPHVGHTFFTYQPLYPEEMLYWHKNRYHNYYDGGRGMNHTKVTYYAPPVRTAWSNLYWNYLRIPR